MSTTGMPSATERERDRDTAPASPSIGEEWSPRVEGEEGDPTWFDFVFGGAVVGVVAVGILWAIGYVTF